jgi:hypothetical protein
MGQGLADDQDDRRTRYDQEHGCRKNKGQPHLKVHDPLLMSRYFIGSLLLHAANEVPGTHLPVEESLRAMKNN